MKDIYGIIFPRVVQFRRNVPLICPRLSYCRHNESRIICPCSACNRITPDVHMAVHHSSCIVIMHIMLLLKVIGVTSEQTSCEFSVL